MRLMLAEDSALLRVGLERLVTDEGHEVVASVGTADELLVAVARDQPDVVVVDVRMPPTHTDEGLRAALRIRADWPGVGVLVLSQYVEKRYATELLGRTASGIGYLLKDRVVRVEEFLDALARVGEGRAAFDPEVVRQLLARPAYPVSALTAREREVLARMAQGQTNARIGVELSISQSAVEKHVNAIFEKLGLSAEGGYSRRVLAVLRHLGA
ncbi:response regulator transcription factor [Cryptosporangium japonicum]|uniref:Response regulator transcription factor n=1 Tax=Cryptosporangium japonicum TaxID=80872 RepID=A0ABP3E4P6_9ACTN